MKIIEVKKLKRKFAELEAVSGVSFDVFKGEIFGFLGPNGAGKSTTISILSTLLKPTTGQAKVNGFDVALETEQVRKSIGVVFQDPSLDLRLTARENLLFHARLYGLSKKESQKRIEDVLKLVELKERENSLVRTFSGGMKRRLEIARGLIHYPKILFLDEPTIGLDPQTRSHIWEYILKLREKYQMTIFMTTHYMNEAEYCDRIAIIDYGKIVALDSPGGLKKKLGGDVIKIGSQKKAELKKEIVAKYKLKIKEDGDFLLLEVKNGEEFLPRLFNELKNPIDSIELRKPTLDDVFLKLTGRKIREEEVSTRDLFKLQMKGHGR